jgi:hypothetical protein
VDISVEPKLWNFCLTERRLIWQSSKLYAKLIPTSPSAVCVVITKIKILCETMRSFLTLQQVIHTVRTITIQSNKTGKRRFATASETNTMLRYCKAFHLILVPWTIHPEAACSSDLETHRTGLPLTWKLKLKTKTKSSRLTVAENSVTLGFFVLQMEKCQQFYQNKSRPKLQNR